MKEKRSDRENKKLNIKKLIRNALITLVLLSVITVLACNLTVIFSADGYIVDA